MILDVSCDRLLVADHSNDMGTPGWETQATAFRREVEWPVSLGHRIGAGVPVIDLANLAQINLYSVDMVQVVAIALRHEPGS